MFGDLDERLDMIRRLADVVRPAVIDGRTDTFDVARRCLALEDDLADELLERLTTTGAYDPPFTCLEDAVWTIVNAAGTGDLGELLDAHRPPLIAAQRADPTTRRYRRATTH